MSDYSAETPIEQTGLSEAVRRPPSLIPWILFGVAAGMLVAVTFVLISQLWNESERAEEHAQLTAKQTARAEKAQQALTQTRAKLEPLEGQVKALTTERDALAERVRVLGVEAAKASAEAAKAAKDAAARLEAARAETAKAVAAAKAQAKKQPVKKRRR